MPKFIRHQREGEKKPCGPIAQQCARQHIRGVMKTKIDSGPPDEPGNDIEKDSISGEPGREKGRHHKGVKGMTTWKTGVEDFSRAFGQS